MRQFPDASASWQGNTSHDSSPKKDPSEMCSGGIAKPMWVNQRDASFAASLRELLKMGRSIRSLKVS